MDKKLDLGYDTASYLLPIPLLHELKMNFVIRVCGTVWITTKSYQCWISKVPVSADGLRWL
ncbi:MAG: hypothetical protein ACUVQT_04220 [bacterium]